MFFGLMVGLAGGTVAEKNAERLSNASSVVLLERWVWRTDPMTNIRSQRPKISTSVNISTATTVVSRLPRHGHGWVCSRQDEWHEVCDSFACIRVGLIAP